MAKVNVDMSGVPATALYTLWVKAQDALKPDSKLNDQWAVEAVEKISNYNFSGFRLDTPTAACVPLRSWTFDKWTTEFLNKHTEATVVNLACGVESRALRLLPAYPGVRWIDVDLPDMVALRKQLMPNPDGDYKLVGASVAEQEWLESIPGHRPTFIIAEGLSMYLSQEIVDDLVSRLVCHFEAGELIFDAVGACTLKIQGMLDFLAHTGSTFTWAIDDFRSIEKLDPGIRLCNVIRHADYEGFGKLPLRVRTSFWVMWYIPWIRNTQTNLRYQFGVEASK
ncbi:tetracenomycin polyketide synthesis O-methyltransferase tcmP [Xylariales sp. PMI_506]|nr:tetracenomycin polyketide synthesis O-methyltransferase tcmP [Xylariales sp. PMI_506]